MSLSFISPRGSLEMPWLHYNLLRDNVIHHLESGGGASEFGAIHRIASASGTKSVAVSASDLFREMRIVSERLLRLPVSELAISASTRSVLQLSWPVVAGPPFAVVGPSVMFGTLIHRARTLGDVFGGAVDSFLELTSDAGPNDQMEVFDT